MAIVFNVDQQCKQKVVTNVIFMVTVKYVFKVINLIILVYVNYHKMIYLRKIGYWLVLILDLAVF